MILAYGTNEAAQRRFDAAEIERQFVEVIARLRQAVPGVAVLLLGPPDLGLRDATGAYVTPPTLGEVIEAERRAAATSGAAFFDGMMALGGPGSMETLLQMDPPLATHGHVHLTSRGYRSLAEALLAAILERYDTAQHAVPTHR